MDYKALRARCVAVLDRPLPEKKSLCLVGIVYHTIRNISGITEQKDILWLPCADVSRTPAIYLKYHSQ